MIAMAADPGTAWDDVYDVLQQSMAERLHLATESGIGSRTRMIARSAGPVSASSSDSRKVVASGRPDERVPEIPAMEVKAAGRTLIHVVATVNLTRRQGKVEALSTRSRPEMRLTQAREPGADSGCCAPMRHSSANIRWRST